MAFIGSINAEARKWLGNIAPLFNGRHVVVGCSGNFTVEQIITRRSSPAFIHGNDVSLYSSVLGAYFSGLEFPLVINGDRLSFAAAFLSTTEDKAATILVMSEMLKFEREKNFYEARIWRHYVDRFPEFHKATVQKLQDRRPGIRIDTYTSKDIAQLLDEIPPESMLISFMPTYAGGYERIYKKLDQLFTWERPTYQVIDKERKAAILDRMRAFEYIYIDDQPREDLPLSAVVRKRGLKTVYLYTNLPLPAKHYMRSSVSSEPSFFQRLDDACDITTGSTITIQRTSNKVINHYRNLYLHKVTEYVDGDCCLLVFVDGRLFGFLIFSINRFATADIYLLSDFVLSVPRYPRLSKLLLLVSRSDLVRAILEEKYVHSIRTILTTAFTDKPVSMKYRGVYELHSRKPGRLNYIAQAGGYTLKEVITLWLKKYDKK